MSTKIPKEIVCKDGTKYWYIDKVLHREDGPAIEFTSGSKEWWEYGIKIK